MKRYFFFITILLIVACSNQIVEHEGGLRVDHSLEGLTYNIEEKAWSPLLADTFLDESMVEIMEAYEIAMHHEELLQSMPCYCGCGDVGHEHNQHCFVSQIEGNVAHLDQMGFG